MYLVLLVCSHGYFKTFERTFLTWLKQDLITCKKDLNIKFDVLTLQVVSGS